MFGNLSPRETCLFYEITWKNISEPDRPRMTITWCMNFECWMTKATDTHSEYVIHYMYIAYLVSVTFSSQL